MISCWKSYPCTEFKKIPTKQCWISSKQKAGSLAWAVSCYRPVRHGVPQGSVLVPLLFILHINDLFFDDKMLIFADDTKLMNRGVKAEKILLEAGFRFISSSWMMQRHKSSSCFWEAKSLRAHRLLGFWLDYRLDWNCHVAQVCKKLLRGIHLLRKLVRAITSDHLLQIYHALFHSHVAYGVFL